MVVTQRVYLGREYALHAFYHIAKLERLRRGLGFILFGLVVIFDELLEVAHGEFVADAFLRQLKLCVRVGHRDQATSVTLGKFAAGDEVYDGLGEGEQAKSIGDAGRDLPMRSATSSCV